MKIKIINMLVKMANDENYKPTFKYKDNIYQYDFKTKYYMPSFMGLYKIYMILNDEVEIIKEDKKIEKISWQEKESLAGEFTASEKQNILTRRTEKLKSSLNELIDEINKLKEK